MTKTLTGYDVSVYVKDISNNVIFALKNVITERMLKHANLLHIHDICHVMIMKVSCQSYVHPFKYNVT